MPRKIIRYRVGAHIAQSPEGHMRHEVPRLGRQARRARSALMSPLQKVEGVRGFDSGPDRAGLVAAEAAKAAQLDLEAVEADLRKGSGEVLRLSLGYVPGETHGDVIIVRVDPMSAAKAGCQARKA